MVVLVDSDDLAPRCHDLHLEHLIGGQAIVGSKLGVTAPGDVSADTDTLGHAANNGGSVLVGCLVQVIHLGAAAAGHGVSLDDGVTVCQLVLVLVERDVIHVVHPDGERARGIGAAEEVVAARFDNKSDVVLPGYTHRGRLVSTDPSQSDYRSSRYVCSPKSTPALTCSAVVALTTYDGYPSPLHGALGSGRQV